MNPRLTRAAPRASDLRRAECSMPALSQRRCRLQTVRRESDRPESVEVMPDAGRCEVQGELELESACGLARAAAPARACVRLDGGPNERFAVIVSAPTRTAAHSRRADIQGLRAVAVVLVVLNHAFAWPVGGFVGVDVFFVISGYVITSSLLREADRDGEVSLRAFIARRVRRLLPAAALVAVVTAVASLAVFHTPRALSIAWDAFASFTSAQNWRLIRQGTQYFAEAAHSPLQHYWSLSVEEQFYVLWPLLFVLLLPRARRTRSRAFVAVVVGSIVAGSFLISIAESALRPAWAYFSLEARAWELGAGVLAAYLGARVAGRLAPRALGALGALGLLLLAVSALVIDGTAMFPGPLAAAPVIGTVALIIAGEHRLPAGGAGRLLASRPALYVGDISYSLYLWHFPVLVIGTAILGSSLASNSLLIFAAGLLAALTYRYVERPLLPRRPPTPTTPHPMRAPHPRARLRNAAWGAAALVLVVAMSVLQLRLPLGDGPTSAPQTPRQIAFSDSADLEDAVRSALSDDSWPTELQPAIDALWPVTAAVRQSEFDACLESASDSVPVRQTRCVFNETGSRTAVVFGDSVAMGWLPAAVDALVPRGWRVIGVGIESCPPFEVDVADRSGRAGFAEECARARSSRIAEIVAESPELVMMTGAFGSYERLRHSVGAAQASASWEEAVRATVSQVASSESRVVMLSSPPERTPVMACATRLSDARPCVSAVPDAWHAKTAAEARGVRGRAMFIDTLGWFCARDACPPQIAGSVVMADAGHLTEAYARRLAAVLSSALPE